MKADSFKPAVWLKTAIGRLNLNIKSILAFKKCLAVIQRLQEKGPSGSLQRGYSTIMLPSCLLISAHFLLVAIHPVIQGVFSLWEARFVLLKVANDYRENKACWRPFGKPDPKSVCFSHLKVSLDLLYLGVDGGFADNVLLSHSSADPSWKSFPHGQQQEEARQYHYSALIEGPVSCCSIFLCCQFTSPSIFPD